MIYLVDVICPRTNEQRTIDVPVTNEQNAVARASVDWMQAIWRFASLPAGFIPVGTRTRPLPLTAIN